MLLERLGCSWGGEGLVAAAMELRRCWRRQDWQIFDCPDVCQERIVDIASFGGNTWPCDYSSHSIAAMRHIQC